MSKALSLETANEFGFYIYIVGAKINKANKYIHLLSLNI